MIPIGLALEPPPPTVANGIDDLIARARQAARTGLASVWLGQVYDVDALTALALIGREVPRIALGTAVVAIHSRHPIALSSQAQTTQAATGGRLLLGVGVGNRDTVERRYGHDFSRPARRTEEYLRALRPLLREGEVTVRGETVAADTSGWSAHVPGSNPAPPILVAAMGPTMLRVAGELADGTVTWLAGPRTIGEHIVPRLHAAAAGGPTPQVVASLPVCITNDPDEARERAATNLAFYAVVPSYRQVLDRETATSPADVALIGNENHIERQLTHLANTGVTHFVANLSGLTTPRERQRTLDFLGTLTAEGG